MKKVFHSEISEKSSNDNGDVTIAGWANKSVVDDVGDLMKFEDVDMSRFTKNPIVFFNHNRNIPVGKVIESKITDAGLWVKAVISKSKDPIVSMVRDLVAEGILKTFSIGFEVKEEKFNRADNYNEITKWKLNEISIVTLPANTDAEFALTKSLEGMSSEEARTAIMKALETQSNIKTKESPEEGKEPCPKCGKYPCECQQEDEEAKKKTAFQECVSAKIPKLVEEGKPEEQAVAIAMSMCREEGKCDISIMSAEMFDHAMGIAKGCKKPKKEDETPAKSENRTQSEKQDGTGVATPLPQASDDPTNFGSPQMDLMKAQLALLGKISVQVGEIQALLEKDEGMGENENVNPAPPPDNGEASAKGLAKIAEIRGRIDALVKDL